MGKKYFNSYEKDSMARIVVAMQALADCEKGIEKRCKETKLLSRLRSAHGLVRSLYDALLAQMTDEEMFRYQMNLRNMVYYYGVKNMGKVPGGRYITLKELAPVVDATVDHCLLCDKSPDQMRQCKLRKSLDSIVKDSDEGIYDHGCRYYGGNLMRIEEELNEEARG